MVCSQPLNQQNLAAQTDTHLFAISLLQFTRLLTSNRVVGHIRITNF